MRRVVTRFKKSEYEFLGTPLFKVSNVPSYLDQTGECFIQTIIENQGDSPVYLQKVVFNPDSIEHKSEALHLVEEGADGGVDLFDQAAVFMQNDQRRYLFKLKSANENTKLALQEN